MTFEQFTQKVVENLAGDFGTDYQVQIENVEKNNGCVLTGVVIRKPDNPIAPTIYLEQYFEKYLCKCIDLDEINESIIHLYYGALERMEAQAPFSVELENIRENIVFRLVSRERNKKMLSSMPFLPFLDLAIIFTVVFNHTEQSVDSVRVTNKMMEMWGLDTKHLMKLSLENSQRLFPPIIEPIEDVIKELVTDEEEIPTPEGCFMLVVTNAPKVNGATVILYPHLIQQLAEKYESNLIILPSSIHEILVLLSNEHDDMDNLCEMVRSVNATNLETEEVLSDHVYVYQRDTKLFEIY